MIRGTALDMVTFMAFVLCSAEDIKRFHQTRG